MRNLNLFLRILILPIICGTLHAQQLKNDFIKEKIISSRIKTKSEFVYFVNNKKATGLKSQIRYYNKNGEDTLLEIFSITNKKVFSRIYKKFNEKGLLSEKRDFKVIDSAGKQIFDLESVFFFEYNSFDRILGWKEYDKHGELIKETKIAYKYDTKGNVTEIITKSDELADCSVEEFQYDINGNKSFYRMLDYFGKPKIITRYYNDSAGRPVGKIYYNPDESEKSKEYSKYDSFGNVIEKSEYAPDSTKRFTLVFFYNSSNDMTEYIRTPYCKDYEYFRMKMEYNKKGDLFKNTAYDVNGKPQKIHKFVYTYY